MTEEPLGGRYRGGVTEEPLGGRYRGGVTEEPIGGRYRGGVTEELLGLPPLMASPTTSTYTIRPLKQNVGALR